MVKNIVVAFQSQLSFHRRVRRFFFPSSISKAIFIHPTDRSSGTDQHTCFSVLRGRGSKIWSSYINVSPARTVQQAFGSKLLPLGHDQRPTQTRTSRLCWPQCHNKLLWIWRWANCLLLAWPGFYLLSGILKECEKTVGAPRDANAVLIKAPQMYFHNLLSKTWVFSLFSSCQEMSTPHS